MEGLSPLHLVIVLVVAVLVLGPGKLPEVGAALGKTLREFRRATSDMAESVRLDATQAAAAVPSPGPASAVASAPATAPSPGLAAPPAALIGTHAEVPQAPVEDGTGDA
jgi:sec-independent protein translocase protein TatA